MCISAANKNSPLPPEPMNLPSTGKPMLPNEDGTYSTERTITIEMGGKHLVLPTIVGGKPYTEDEAIELFKNGKNKPVGEFDTENEANDYARSRTRSLGREIEKMGK